MSGADFYVAYRSGHAPAPVRLGGLGKRTRGSEEEHGEGNAKRTRVGSSTMAELPRIQQEQAPPQRQQIELFPENIGALYAEVPAYGKRM